MTGLVSVIIPMYNSELFIKQCLQSVTRQTYQNLEILVIDDGSTDAGVQICNELCQSDDRIKIFRQENRGISAARNRGLKEARGEYIFFLDSDDALHPHLIHTYITQMETNTQAVLAFCDYLRLGNLRMAEISEEEGEENHEVKGKSLKGTEGERWFHLHPKRKLSGIGGKMIRRKFIEGMRFDERLTVGEDTVFLYMVSRTQLPMIYFPLEWYYYRVHSVSTTHLSEMQKNGQAFKFFEIIRNAEKKRGHKHIAVLWQYRLLLALADKYFEMKEKNDIEICQVLRKRAAREMRHPLSKDIPMRIRVLLHCCFIDYRLHPLLKNYTY